MMSANNKEQETIKLDWHELKPTDVIEYRENPDPVRPNHKIGSYWIYGTNTLIIWDGRKSFAAESYLSYAVGYARKCDLYKEADKQIKAGIYRK